MASPTPKNLASLIAAIDPLALNVRGLRNGTASGPDALKTHLERAEDHLQRAMARLARGVLELT